MLSFPDYCKIGDLSYVKENLTESLHICIIYLGFRYACQEGHLEVAQYVKQYIDEKISNDEIKKRDFFPIYMYAFRCASQNGYIDIVKWLYCDEINKYVLEVTIKETKNREVLDFLNPIYERR